MKLLLPGTAFADTDDPALPDGVTAVGYDVTRPIPEEHRDAEGLVVWGNPGSRLAEAAGALPRLRWVQTLAAGPDTVLAAGFRPDVRLASGVGLHDAPVTEHALALVLHLVRRLGAAAQAQAESRWDRDLGGLQPLHPPGPVTTLLGARVLIWGFGSIGQTLAPLLTGLGAQVTGVARTAGRRGDVPVVDDDGLDAELARTDVLVMILPDTPGTTRALDAHRLAQLPAGAFVVNVGRGSTVDEPALLSALAAGHLAGVALDVVATEPLPTDSPLWTAPRLLITPHAAGGRPVHAAELVAANAAALLAGSRLRNEIDR